MSPLPINRQAPSCVNHCDEVLVLPTGVRRGLGRGCGVLWERSVVTRSVAHSLGLGGYRQLVAPVCISQGSQAHAAEVERLVQSDDAAHF